jgi:hypothetical protein
MKYREYLMGGPIDPPKKKSQLTDEQNRQLAMSYARYNQAPRPIGPEAGLRPVEPVFGAMVVAPGLRGLAQMVKNPPAKQAWEAMPYDKYKDAAEFIIGPR